MALVFFGMTASAQVVTIGAGLVASAGNDQTNPIYRSSAGSAFNFSRAGHLYTAAEIAAAPIPNTNSITAIGIFKSNTFTLSAGRTATLNIYMKNSAATALTPGTDWTTAITGATLVYSNAAVSSANIPAVAGFVTFPLTSSFIYTGGALEVYYDWAVNTGVGNPATGAFLWTYDVVPTVQAIGAAAAAALPANIALSNTLITGTNLNRRYRAQFTHTTTPTCTTPAPGNTIASASLVCPGTAVNLSLQNATSGIGVSYTWQVSTVSNSGPWTTIGSNSSTLLVAPEVQSWYQCQVACSFASTVASNPVQVNMDPTFTNPQDFASGVINNGCWRATGAGLAYSALSGFGVGVGSARWNFYNIGAGAQQTLTSPFFTPVPSGWRVRFDVASQNYDAVSIDTIKVEEFNGTSWVLLQTMTNNIGDLLATVPGSNTASFTPGPTSWATRNFTLTPGTTRIRFRGISGFGNNAHVDNITVEPVPVCLTPEDVAAVATSFTTATVSWTDNGAVSYNVEIRSSGAPGSGPVGLVASATGLAGSPYLATGLPSLTNLQAYVQGNCGLVNGLSAWSTAGTFRTDYCLAAGSATAVDELIANVSVSNLNNTTSETAGYVDFTGGTPVNMAPGVVYPLSVGIGPSVYTSDQVLVWIDLNNDLDFTDPNEQRFVSILPLGANPVVGSLSVPSGTPAGSYRMRVRLHDSSFGANNTPCGNSGYGQVEDYTVNVCGAPVATVSVVDNCVANQLDAVVTFSSFGSGGLANSTVTYSVNNGPSTTFSASAGPISLTANGMVAGTNDVIQIAVGNGTLCALDLGDWYTNCPDSLDCGIISERDYCYKNGDTRTFHYVADPGQTVSLNFIAGSLDLADVVNFFDGPDNLSTPLGGGNFLGDLSSADFVTTGQDLYFEINSGSSNSCEDGGQTIPWDWEILCTPDCTPPTGFAEYVLPISCTPPGFFLDVTVNSAGASNAGGVNPLPTVDIEWTGGATGSLTGVAEGSTVQIGPFPLGSTVNVVMAHAENDLCNLNLGNFTQASTCPPANDDCVNAQVLTIAGIEGCPAGAVTGTTAFGSNSTGGSIPAPTCNNGAGTIQDVWYTFNTGNLGSPILFNISSGTIVNYAVQLYQAGVTPAAACVGTSIGCLTGSPGAITFTNAPANTQYYLRVFTNTGTGTAGTFDICMSGSACPAPTAVTVSGVTSSTATVNWTGPAGTYYVEYGPSATFTTPGTGATAGVNGTVITASGSPATITGLDPSTNYVVFVRRDCGSPDGFSFNSAGTLFLTSPPPTPTTQGTCALNLAIPDNGCGSGNSLSAQFNEPTVGTLGSTLVLESVDLIITHTWRSDLEVRLVSPNGTTRSLILGRGGSDDDFGNNANCPTGVLKLRDGAASLATLPLSNATVGTYAPEQPLSGFTGPSNGNWQIVICDAFGTDIGALQYVKLNFANCVGPTYTTTVVPACGTNQFNVSVNVTNLGSATGYTITNSVNGSTVSVPGTGTYTVGPFASGASVNLTLVHNVNTSCNATTSGITFTCPPANDDCANAIAINCNSVTLGTTIGATATDNPGTCVTDLSTAPGVWYTVQGWGGTMTASTCAAGAFDTKLGVFTGTCGAFTCITGNDDDFTCTSSGLASGVTWTSVANTTYYIYVTGFATNAGPFVLTTTCGQVAPPPCVANGLSIEIEADANTAQTSWDIVPQGLTSPVCSGAGPYNPGSVIPEYCCLPDGCYRLRVFDSAGDGITDGGYALRTMTTGNRIIDNTNNFTTGAVSAISTNIAGGNFCLPIGTDKLIFSSCDKLNWVPNTYVVATANPAVSAQWLVGNQADDGYEFWIFDPNGSYSFRRFRNHATSDGFSPASANRACHMKINSWVNTPSTPHIPFNRLLNVRVRSRVNGVNSEFGPACRFNLVATVTCPQVSLQDDPANADFSCGVTRSFGGVNSAANRIVARPPQFFPANVPSSSVRYQFRFRLVSEGICIIRPPQTSATLHLNWTPGTGNNAPLLCGRQYDVEVRVSRDGGATWCVDVPGVTCASPYVQWGPVCKVNTPACPSAMPTAPGNSGHTDPTVTMYPNPNNGTTLSLSATGLETTTNSVNVDIFDMAGKRLVARTLPVQDGYLNTVLDLNGDLSGGVYMVNITAGDRTFTERLVIQP